MTKKNYFLILILLGALSFAQTQSSDFVQINGVYLDVNGFPEPDFEIKVFGTNISTKTDEDGKFTLMIPKEMINRLYLEYIEFPNVIYKKRVKDFDKLIELKMSFNPAIHTSIEFPRGVKKRVVNKFH